MCMYVCVCVRARARVCVCVLCAGMRYAGVWWGDMCAEPDAGIIHTGTPPFDGAMGTVGDSGGG